MSKTIGHRFLLVMFYMLALVPIAAAAELVHINYRARVGDDAELEQGTYRVEVERTRNSAEVLFYQGEELVAAARAKLTNEEVKSNHTEVHSEEVDGTRVITKIWLRGWKESLVFEQGTREAE